MKVFRSPKRSTLGSRATSNLVRQPRRGCLCVARALNWPVLNRCLSQTSLALCWSKSGNSLAHLDCEPIETGSLCTSMDSTGIVQSNKPRPNTTSYLQHEQPPPLISNTNHAHGCHDCGIWSRLAGMHAAVDKGINWMRTQRAAIFRIDQDQTRPALLRTPAQLSDLGQLKLCCPSSRFSR